jgi:hypothetical protein
LFSLDDQTFTSGFSINPVFWMFQDANGDDNLPVVSSIQALDLMPPPPTTVKVPRRKAGLITVGAFLIDKVKHVSESIFRSNCWSEMIGLRVCQPGSVRSANVLVTMP